MQRRTLGRRNIETDAKDLRVLINAAPVSSTAAEFQLQSDTIVTDTTLVTNRTPLWLIAYGFWVVIDPWTTECEVRLVTAVSGSTLTVAALDYAHSASDPMLFIDAPIVNVKWFGALGDGTTDDLIPFSRAMIQADNLPFIFSGKTGMGSVFAPMGYYRLSAGINVPVGVEFFGNGRATVLSPTAGFSPAYTPEVTGLVNYGDVANAGAGGWWHGGVRDIAISGNSVSACEVGLYILRCVNAQFSNVRITNFTGGTYSAGLVMDAGQNAVFDNIYTNNVATSFLMVNGAQNNVITGSQLTCWNDATKDKYLVRLQGANTDFYGQGLIPNDHCADNSFEGNMIETFAGPQASFLIDDGDGNSLYGNTIAQSHNTTCYPIVKLLTSAQHNVVDHCTLVRASESVAGNIFENRGEDNHFERSLISNSKAGDEIHTYARTHIIRTHLGNAVIANQSGNIYDNVHFVPERVSGAVGDRPAPGDAFFHYFDVSRDSLVWYDGTNDRWTEPSTMLSPNPTPYDVTLNSSGAFPVVQAMNNWRVDTYAAASSDNLDTISDGVEGQIIYLQQANAARDVTVRDTGGGTGNIRLREGQDWTMDTTTDIIVLLRRGTNWYELYRFREDSNDILYGGDLAAIRNSGTEYNPYAYVPLDTYLTTTNFDGDSFSDTAKTLMDMSSEFGATVGFAGIKAYKLLVFCRDSGSATNTPLGVCMWNNNTSQYGTWLSCSGLVADALARSELTVPADASGDIYYQFLASGTTTLDVWVRVMGYYL